MSMNKNPRAGGRSAARGQSQTNRELTDTGQRSSIRAVSEGPEVFSTLAGDYFSTAFPNPGRTGCIPLQEVAESVVARGGLSGDWYEHLLQCSECFREYRQAPPHLRALLKSEAGKFAMYEFLEEIGFFAPSPELTRNIIEHNRDLGESDRQYESVRDLPHENYLEPQYDPEGPPPPSTDPVGRWYDFIETYRGRVYKLEQESDEELARVTRRSRLAIADMLYGYLSVLARQPQSRDGLLYDIRLVIPWGMGRRLGLTKPMPAEKRIELESECNELRYSELFDERSLMLLRSFTEEFILWLSKKNRGGVYAAPWGEIRLEDSHYMFLKPAPRERKRKLRPYSGKAHYGSSGIDLRRRERG